ncbi:3-isopropylmalate dehydratase small subunit [Rhodococcus pyridinivorans]|uniref:3-isopropylmalate dehydratase small subunit n=1 Tax=Rhodococcus pyridinivorans TaxID=103816 RepID=UPI0020C6D16C|nr:3-isopropylmalate dehydratase small subunit [Rhodococcus pyridinivorans]UTM36831.1 3-isopropylmalate dehydratase small subunit [Rhodococcus pyridinivorans]
MEALDTWTGIAAPLRRDGIDTDQICPSEFMKRITRTGYQDGLFATWRTQTEFILNQAPYTEASILLAGADFGIGSSREHVVWALHDFGFRVVLSPSFADIFRGNAAKGGLLAGVVTPADLGALSQSVEASPTEVVTVDLRARTATHTDLTVGFDIDDHTRHRLLHGLDDIAATLQTGTQARRQRHRQRPPRCLRRRSRPQRPRCQHHRQPRRSWDVVESSRLHPAIPGLRIPQIPRAVAGRQRHHHHVAPRRVGRSASKCFVTVTIRAARSRLSAGRSSESRRTSSAPSRAFACTSASAASGYVRPVHDFA